MITVLKTTGQGLVVVELWRSHIGHLAVSQISCSTCTQGSGRTIRSFWVMYCATARACRFDVGVITEAQGDFRGNPKMYVIRI